MVVLQLCAFWPVVTAKFMFSKNPYPVMDDNCLSVNLSILSTAIERLFQATGFCCHT